MSIEEAPEGERSCTTMGQTAEGRPLSPSKWSTGDLERTAVLACAATLIAIGSSSREYLSDLLNLTGDESPSGRLSRDIGDL